MAELILSYRLLTNFPPGNDPYEIYPLQQIFAKLSECM